MLGIKLDSKLNFNSHVHDIGQKAGQKLNAISGVTPYMDFAERRLLVNAFFYPQFNYCQLVWMCHNRTNNNKINRPHERCLHLIYNDKNHLIENMNLEPSVLIPQLNMNEVQNGIAEVRNASINDEDLESQDNFIEPYSQEIEEARLDMWCELSRTEHQDFSERDSLPKITNSGTLNIKIKFNNVALKKIVRNKECDLSNLNAIIYATGKAISNQMGVQTKRKKSKHTKVKIQKKIDVLRAEFSILDEISKGTAVKTRKARKVRNRNNVTDENSLLAAKETLKQKNSS